VKTSLHVLKAHHGDCLIIQTFDNHQQLFTILIDGGPLETFRTTLAHELPKYPKIDLIVLTHIDSDHIAGLLQYLKSPFAENNSIDSIIINAPNLVRVNTGTQISYDEGVELEELLHSDYPNLKIIGNVVSDRPLNLSLPDGIEIKILSPNQHALDLLYSNWPFINLRSEETTQISSSIEAKDSEITFADLSSRKNSVKTVSSDVFNASSIAFSLKSPDFHGLFLGDSHPTIVCKSLIEVYNQSCPIDFDYVKVSHHGSRFNISNELLDCIKCTNFIISTNGGHGRAKHPDRETVAKIVMHKNSGKDSAKIYFNYPLDEIEQRTGKLFSEEEMKLFIYEHRNLLP
jgi:beta-lactamase superfamily II metal-dependent hydrolase